MKTPICILLIATMFFLMPRAVALAETDGLIVDSHGMLMECDDETRENHLYLMNAEKLGLSAKQIKELRDIKGECDNLCITDRVRLRVAKVELAEILKSEVIDMPLAKEKIKEISALQDNLRVRHLKTKVKAMMVLSENQKDKASALRD
ncbi:MAG: hypothetical protein RQ824_10655 [bacterium]|nr:hypothetical protein [bacterium]